MRICNVQNIAHLSLSHQQIFFIGIRKKRSCRFFVNFAAADKILDSTKNDSFGRKGKKENSEKIR